MSESEEVKDLSQQLAQRIINNLIEKNLLQNGRHVPAILDKIANGKMSPEDWKFELERIHDSANQE